MMRRKGVEKPPLLGQATVHAISDEEMNDMTLQNTCTTVCADHAADGIFSIQVGYLCGSGNYKQL